MRKLLQQYLPFTVLKLKRKVFSLQFHLLVATVLTVYGIETGNDLEIEAKKAMMVATALTVYGIETRQ